ncbi:serine/threonine-protein kinase [Petropleomorpha daqingensis]|uniref:Serine/threonine-protein kinase n=1 Tax=Petropleomorpha daqingensis TaxID=2026353 RepID=A0A853C9S0_9ACTN|nr:serine/threonine-protein kinase [Petropleomorpha daqingensis]NYJ04384.1 serine/threonine-protein kinase [Petropleomorpha daqingensis]
MFRRRFGPFELLSFLGSGDTGEVYRARDTRSGRRVALKLFFPALSRDAEYVLRVQRDATAVSRLRSPFLLPVREVGELHRRLFVAMHLLEGRDLGAVLARSGPLAPQRAVAIVGRVAAALDTAAAAGLLHLGVKPSNVLLAPGDAVLLSDFGVARPVGRGRASLVATGATVQTLEHLAPEQFTDGVLDARTDVHALACLLHETLTGRPPFPGGDLRAQQDAHLHRRPPRASVLVDGVPPALDDVIARGMARWPQDRFATAGELAGAARAALRVPLPVAAGPGPLTDRPARPPRGRPEVVPVDRPRLLAPAPPYRFSGNRTTSVVAPPQEEPVAPRRRPRGRLVAVGAVVVLAGTGVAVAVSAGSDDGPAASSGHPTVVATMDVGVSPSDIALSPDGRTAYVAGRGRDLWVLDTAAGRVTGTVDVPDGPAWYVSVSPDGRRAYVSVKDDAQTVSRVVVLDPAAGTEVASVPVGPRPFSSAVTPDGREVWVAGHEKSEIDVIDVARGEVTATIPVAESPHAVAFSADGRWAYVASHETDTLTVLNTRTRGVVATLPGGDAPYGVAVSPDGDRLAVADRTGGTVTVVDTLSNRVLATARVGGHPEDVAWAPDGRHLYTADAEDGTVSVVDARTYRRTAAVPVGTSPSSIAVRPDGERAYVTNVGDGTVSVLDLTTG